MKRDRGPNFRPLSLCCFDLFGLQNTYQDKYNSFHKLTAISTKQLNRNRQPATLPYLPFEYNTIDNIAELTPFYASTEELSGEKKKLSRCITYYCYFHNLTELSWLPEATIPVTGDCANAAIRPS